MYTALWILAGFGMVAVVIAVAWIVAVSVWLVVSRSSDDDSCADVSG